MFVYYDLGMLQTRNCKITEIIKANNSWMILFPDKIYPALSFKCGVTNLGMNVIKLSYVDDIAFTKKLIWPSNSSVY